MAWEWTQQAVMFVPWVKAAGDRRMRIDTADIVKTIITSAVVSGVVMYGTQRVMENELAHLKEEMRETKRTVEMVAQEQFRRKPMADYIEHQMRGGKE